MQRIGKYDNLVQQAYGKNNYTIQKGEHQMKKLDKIVCGILLMLLGALIYGFIEAAAKVYGSRAAGNFGGEVFVLPLMAGLIWLGWQMRENLHK